MTAPSVDHATFVIERSLKAPAARVFRAWSDLALKQQWNSCHDEWHSEEHRLDFRPGGSEISRVVEPNGTAHIMKAHYFDVVPDRRIVYAYEMYLDELRISVSLVTVMFAPAGRAGATTRMTFTEQVTFLDGHGDLDERREGTEVGLRRLAVIVAAGEIATS
jgi:uncharacterized protein YndB with AHSA1/START domain